MMNQSKYVSGLLRYRKTDAKELESIYKELIPWEIDEIKSTTRLSIVCIAST